MVKRYSIIASPFIGIWLTAGITAVSIVVSNYPLQWSSMFENVYTDMMTILEYATSPINRLPKSLLIPPLLLALLLPLLCTILIKRIIPNLLDYLSRKGGLLPMLAVRMLPIPRGIDPNVTLDSALLRVGEMAVEEGVLEGEGG